MITGCNAHIDLSRRAAAEGMVLLKNENNVLPLAAGAKLALFGQASVNYIKGGTGSGDVHCAYIRNFCQGLQTKQAEGKVSLFPGLEEFYTQWTIQEKARVEAIKAEARKEKTAPGWQSPEAMVQARILCDKVRDIFVEEAEVPAELFDAARAFTDTAVVVLNRISGKGCDRDGRKGDFCLTDKENALLDRVSAAFEQCIVVLNVGGVVQVAHLQENPKINGILLSWQAGMEGGLAAADILCGDINPSGKLATTFARNLADYPSANHFDDSDYYVEYMEDIYVGYRYFETIPGAARKVLYPFGYGLSYTTFNLAEPVCTEENGVITANITVTNTGDRAGKEVVQAYFSAPQGLLGKPAKALCAFQKTNLLAPGESQSLTLSWKATDMASFDDLGKVQKAAYVLEKGEYRFYIGTSVRDTTEAEYIYTLENDVVAQQLSELCIPVALPKRLLADGSYETLPQGEARHCFAEHKPLGGKAPAEIVGFDRLGKDISMENFVAQFTDKELCEFMSVSPNVGVSNTFSFSSLERLSVPPAPTADGPAGLRIDEEHGIPTTAWPCATLLACTWNPDLLEEIGKAGGAEVKENDLKVWLTPALNIHRTPLCGRNFEYFSEDPLISGKMAAAKVRGIQSNGIAACVKHFACNNRELYRQVNDSRVSQRAMREIYLKGFEICVKESNPWTLMTSYNLLNGIHTSESTQLIAGILRGEWGYAGMITTDWGIKNDPVTEVKAGNDMKMEIGYPEELETALKEGKLTRGDLEACAKRILTVYQRIS